MVVLVQMTRSVVDWDLAILRHLRRLVLQTAYTGVGMWGRWKGVALGVVAQVSCPLVS